MLDNKIKERSETMATQKKKNAGGRPKAITDTVLRKLEEGFLKGYNVT